MHQPVLITGKYNGLANLFIFLSISLQFMYRNDTKYMCSCEYATVTSSLCVHGDGKWLIYLQFKLPSNCVLKLGGSFLQFIYLYSKVYQ